MMILKSGKMWWLTETARYGSLLAVLAASQASAHSQVAPASVGGDETVFLGIGAAGEHVSYGSRSLYGPRVFVDASLNLRWGVEGSASWENVNQRDGVRQETYMGGLRYTFAHWRTIAFAAKALVGDANFHFPYDYAQGSYLVVAPGGDVNLRLCRAIRWEVVDAEYKLLPQFTYGRVREPEVSTGLRFRVR